MDSTMIQQECIDELADLAGVGLQVKGITAKAMNGELDFEQALRARVALLEGQPASIIDQALKTRIFFTAGGAELLATMKSNGAYTALVSGGFTAFTQPVSQHLGFHEHHANKLLVDQGVVTGQVSDPILGQQAKVEALERLIAQLSITAQDVLAVGDGANDLGMLQRAGSGVALHAKPSVAAQCDIRINHGDLTALLFLQGYPRSAFHIAV
jgi:phosphoserine phosphatase